MPSHDGRARLIGWNSTPHPCCFTINSSHAFTPAKRTPCGRINNNATPWFACQISITPAGTKMPHLHSHELSVAVVAVGPPVSTTHRHLFLRANAFWPISALPTRPSVDDWHACPLRLTPIVVCHPVGAAHRINHLWAIRWPRPAFTNVSNHCPLFHRMARVEVGVPVDTANRHITH